MSAARQLRAIADGVQPVRWTPELTEQARLAPVATAVLEQRGEVTVRVLRRREHRVEVLGEDGHEKRGCVFTLVLVAVDGEAEPRWIAAERLGASEVA